MTDHRVGTKEEWLVARQELLIREKELTRLSDDLARARRELPWVPVEKEYRFATTEGVKTLVELFGGRSQLLMYHFMFGPSYEAGCPVCSSSADTVNGVVSHLNARDVTMVYVSRAPLARLQAYRERMGWAFSWVSAADSDFNFDFAMSQTDEQASRLVESMAAEGMPPVLNHMADTTGTDVAGYLTEAPGFSAFALDGDVVYHTYSTTARGLEFLMGYYQILDRAPKGRDESDSAQVWIRRHDEYEHPLGPV
jgi:predicted dithiol-disulfide oxidoreductase (DUF899 family)